MNTHHGTVQNLPGIAKARRIAAAAERSERQAEAYVAFLDAIADLPEDEETKNQEISRFTTLADEFYENAEALREEIDPELIDYL